MRTVDIIILGIVIIIIALIIGFNIVNVIDTKLNNVSVNIPPIPVPNIVVNVQKKDGEYSVFVNNEKIEHFTSIKKEDNSETKTISSIPLFTNEKSGTSHNVTYPDHDNIISYGDYVCYKRGTKEEPNREIKSEANIENPNKDKINCPRIPNTFDKPNDNISCQGNSPHNEIQKIDEIDPADYYKDNVKFLRTILEDPKLRGYNVELGDKYANPLEIGKISLNRTTNHPMSKNYAFNQ